VNKNNGKNEPKQKQKQKSTEKPSIDSIDSVICGWGTHMRMGHRATQGTIGDVGDDGDDWRRLVATIPGISNDGNNTSIDDEAKERIRSIS
jgi:hypothetical protein